MALTVPNVGEVLLLSYSVNKIASGDLKLHLYTAISFAISEDTVIGHLTEANAAGYGIITLTGSDWTVASVGSVSTATHVEKTFTFTAASTNLGYYVTDAANTGLLWIEVFSDSPHTIPADGGTEKITLKLIGE